MSDGEEVVEKSPREQALQRPLNIDLFREALSNEHRCDQKLEERLQKSNIWSLERRGLAITGLYIDELKCSYHWGNKYTAILKSCKKDRNWAPALVRPGAMLVVMEQEPPVKKDPNTVTVAELQEASAASHPAEAGEEEEEPKEKFQATVLRSSAYHIEILLNNPLPFEKVFVMQGTSDIPHSRMDSALQDIQTCNTHLSELIMGGSKLPYVPDRSPFYAFNRNLDASQLEAVKFALEEAVSVIHGPPGTGKTSTVVEIIRQFTRRGKRVMVCAASNAAVDNIIVRTKQYYGEGVILRLGAPGRIAFEAREVSLEIKKGRRFGGKRKTKKIKQRMAIFAQEKLERAQIVFGTLHASGHDMLDAQQRPFDVVIIDEVSQATLAQAIVPIAKNLGTTQLVVAGDPKQLPPTILSTDVKVKQVLEVTLFDLLVHYYGHRISKLLNTQYRMSDRIMRFSAEEMYDDLLKAAECVHSIDLHGLQGVRRDAFLKSPIIFIDTKGTCPEEKDKNTKSTRNMGEAQLVYRYVNRLLNSGLAPSQIGVITPYGAQTALVKQLLPKMDVSTVDGFQGQEREVIIMSMARSNTSGTIGFVGDERRLNVAITRAKRHLCVIGDATTLASGGFLKRWTKHLWAEHQVRCPETMFDGPNGQPLEQAMAQLVI